MLRKPLTGCTDLFKLGGQSLLGSFGVVVGSYVVENRLPLEAPKQGCFERWLIPRKLAFQSVWYRHFILGYDTTCLVLLVLLPRQNTVVFAICVGGRNLVCESYDFRCFCARLGGSAHLV